MPRLPAVSARVASARRGSPAKPIDFSSNRGTDVGLDARGVDFLPDQAKRWQRLAKCHGWVRPDKMVRVTRQTISRVDRQTLTMEIAKVRPLSVARDLFRILQQREHLLDIERSLAGAALSTRQ